MSPALVMYFDDLSMKSIADAHSTTAKCMETRLFKERKKLNLSKRSTVKVVNSELEADKSLILALIDGGVSVKEAAKKWEVHKQTLMIYLRKWGYDTESKKKSVESWSIPELHKRWVYAPDELIITVNDKPEFKLVRIKR